MSVYYKIKYSVKSQIIEMLSYIQPLDGATLINMFYFAARLWMLTMKLGPDPQRLPYSWNLDS